MDKNNYKLLQEVKDLLEIQVHPFFNLLKNELKDTIVIGYEWINLSVEFWPDGAISGVIGNITKRYLDSVDYINGKDELEFWQKLYILQGFASDFDDENTLYHLKNILQNKKLAIQKKEK